MDIDNKAVEILKKMYELEDFFLANGFKIRWDMEEPWLYSLFARKGAVRTSASLYLNRFRLTTSTGTSESCALTDLKIGGGSLIINGKEFVI